MTDKVDSGAAQVIANALSGSGCYVPANVDRIQIALDAAGYVIARKDPTFEMMTAGREALNFVIGSNEAKRVYEAMIRAGGHVDG